MVRYLGLRFLFIFGLVSLAACSNNDNDDDTDGLSFSQSLFVANDQGSDSGSVERFSANGGSAFGIDTPAQSFSVGLSEGIDLDAQGNMFQAGISGSGSLRAACSFQNRTNGASFTAGTDREITTSLTGPKGIVHVQDAGVIIVAENGAPTAAVSVFSSTAGAGSAPLFTVSRLSVGDTGAWDIAYDADSDKLFVALINGAVAYIPTFLANSGATAPTIFQPDNPLETGTNMHGIAYDASTDTLVVSDVAVPSGGDFDTDGSIYVFNNASSLTGSVTPARTLRGPATRLGNPVDIVLSGNDLIVAEKANNGGQILAFANITTGASGNIAPDLVEATVAGQPPEALALAANPIQVDDDLSDLVGGSSQQLFATSNAAGTGTQIFSVESDLSAATDLFTPVLAGQFVESISLDANGDALVSFDDGMDPSAGGLSFINRLGQRTAVTAFDVNRDRQVVGTTGGLFPTDETTLVAPKGFDVVSSRGVVMVADLNAAAPGAVKIFSLCADGNIAPLATTTLPANTRPWDVDYDPEADRLFVAATNGTVLVYDDYLVTPGTATPDRIIDPDDQSGFPDSNLHGIVHDAASDRLILSDVGSAAVADDGRIYVIENASTAEGITALRLEIAGPSTMLGNPVDLAFDGNDLF
ncbi:MAG: hypothetical protein R3352_07745, partial [Salinisphaeraceae bacterium]|nr:hypothetical protein [Salinisphaeraceae bacterium]